MVTKTDPSVIASNASNPQMIIDAMVRTKIYNSRYWKENCMGLTAESLIDEAIQLKYVAGCYGGVQKPSRFIILVQKMLQIGPDTDIVLELIHNPDYKYISCLAMFYHRLMGTQESLFLEFEKLYTDYRKIRIKNMDGSFSLIHMDEYAHMLLMQPVALGISLPHIQKRMILEELGKLQPRISILEKELEIELAKEEQLKQEFIEKVNDRGDQQEDGIKNEDSEGNEKKPKKKKHKKDKKEKNWKKVVKGKHQKSQSKSRSRSPKRRIDPKIKKQQDELDEWNRLRAEIGAKPLLPQ